MPDEPKKQFKVYVSSTLFEDFMTLIARKHGTHKHGLISYEVETALKQYIASYHSTHTQTHKIEVSASNPFPKVYAAKQEILTWLGNTDYYVNGIPQFIPESHLNQAISHTKGGDPRTLRRWKKDLLECGCIKRSGPHQFEFV